MDPDRVPHVEMTGYINNNTLLLPQTESLEGIGNLRRILALEGVPGTAVGTYDLALDIGGAEPGTSRLDMTRSPAVQARLAEIARICQEAGKVAAIGGVPPVDMAGWAAQGYGMFIFGTVTEGRLDSVDTALKETRRLIG